MCSVHYSKMLTPTSRIEENTYYYEFVCDEHSDLPSNKKFEGTNIGHGSIAFVVTGGYMTMMKSDGTWVIIS